MIVYSVAYTWTVHSAGVLEFEEGFYPDDRSSNPVLLSCKSMVAWLRAGMSLSRSKIFRIAELPKFHVVHSYLRSDVSSTTNLQELMKETLLPRLMPGNDALIQQLIDRSDFKKKVKFSGTIHCEALLMALIHSFSVEPPQKRIPPFSQQKTQTPYFL